MARYILDTNMLVGCARDAAYWRHAVKEFGILDSRQNDFFCSIVTKGEILSLGRQFKWGEQKLSTLNSILTHTPFIAIAHPPIIDAYALLDSFTVAAGKTMGKNDLWIAATAYAAKATIISTDKDFDFLKQNSLIDAIWVDVAMR